MMIMSNYYQHRRIVAMSEEQQQEQEQTQEQEQQQIAERPEHIPEKFWNAETGEPRLEEAFKSYTHLEQKMSGKSKAPEAYELGFSEDFDAEMIEGIDSEDPLIKSMMEIAKENDLGQEGFNKFLNAFIGSEIEDMKAFQAEREAEMNALGENKDQRIKDIKLWLDATLDKETATGLKASMTTASAVEGLEKLKEATRAPSLNVGDDLSSEMIDSHAELKERQFAKDANGNRKMSDPAYAKRWREDAAAANYRA